MPESVKFTVTPARREAINAAVRKAIKEKFGHPVAVLGFTATSPSRYSNKEGVWGGFERYILENSYTVFVSLSNPNDPKASVSTKPDKYAAGKFEDKQKREAERKAKPKAEKKVVLREASKRQTVKVKVVKHDASKPTLEGGERQVAKA